RSVPKRPHAIDGNDSNWLNGNSWALNSAVECHLHTVEVTGSNPVAPTIFCKGLRGIRPKSPTHNSTHNSLLTAPSLKPFPIPSGMPLARPVFHRHRPGYRYPASSECGSDARCSAPSWARPSLCSQASWKASAGGCEARTFGRGQFAVLRPWLPAGDGRQRRLPGRSAHVLLL